jgi:hypothetical protein
MDRRALIFGIAFGLATGSLAARAQQPVKVYRIGFLAFGSRETTAPYVNAFEDRLRADAWSHLAEANLDR